MFFRLLWESFRRQRRRKLLAGVAILLGTTAVTAMLALATTIGDRIHRELAVYGANIVITPAAAGLDVNVGGVAIRPATGNAFLKESDLEKLRGIFWANNITGVSPELDSNGDASRSLTRASSVYPNSACSRRWIQPRTCRVRGLTGSTHSFGISIPGRHSCTALALAGWWPVQPIRKMWT